MTRQTGSSDESEIFMKKFKRLLFIVNPNAGLKRETPFDAICTVFEDHDYEVIVCFTRAAGDGTVIVRDHAGDDIDLIVCMGGDGTLNETFAGAYEIGWRKPIGYIPAGTTNDFASSIGLPSDHVEAAKHIMEHEPHDLDLGMFNGRMFVYTACCGIFTKTSYETPQKIKNVFGHLAYVLEGVKDLTQIHSIHMKIDTGTEKFEDNYLFVSMCNTYSLGGVMTLDESQVSLSDGEFELFTIAMPRDLLQLNTIITALASQKYDEANDLVHFTKVKNAEILFPQFEDWSLDGERGEGREKNKFSVVHDAVRLIY